MKQIRGLVIIVQTTGAFGTISLSSMPLYTVLLFECLQS